MEQCCENVCVREKTTYELENEIDNLKEIIDEKDIVIGALCRDSKWKDSEIYEAKNSRDYARERREKYREAIINIVNDEKLTDSEKVAKIKERFC